MSSDRYFILIIYYILFKIVNSSIFIIIDIFVIVSRLYTNLYQTKIYILYENSLIPHSILLDMACIAIHTSWPISQLGYGIPQYS